MPTYRSFDELKEASYFAFPPKADQMIGFCPDGSTMTVLAQPVPPDLWRWSDDPKGWLHSRTGRFVPFTDTLPISETELKVAVLVREEAVWQADGYASREEWLADRLRERRQGEHLIDKVSQYVPRPRKDRPLKTFSPRDLETHPADYFTDRQIRQMAQEAGQALVDFCSIARLCPHERRLEPTLAGRFREMLERELYSVEAYGQQLNATIKAHERADLGSEIDGTNIAELERQRHYLRVKFYVLQQMDRGVVDAYGHVIREWEKVWGDSWYAYKGIQQRATHRRRAASERDGAETVRHAMADVLDPVEFARWAKALRTRQPHGRGTEGVDTPDEGLTPRMLKGRKVKEDRTSDGIRRAGEASLSGYSDEDLRAIRGQE